MLKKKAKQIFCMKTLMRMIKSNKKKKEKEIKAILTKYKNTER